MNHLKHIFSVSANLTNRASLRASSISRSAGTDGNGSKRSKNVFGPTNDGDNSAELKVTDKSYAKLILDYGREIEARNGTTKFNREYSNSKRNRFFAKSPLQRFGRVPSLVKINNGRNNSGPCLSTKSSSSPPPNSTTDNNTQKKVSNDDKNVRERSEWVDKTYSNDHEKGKYKAHPLVQKIEKLKPAGNVNSNESINLNERQISSVQKLSEIPQNVTKNVSVIVEPREKNATDKNDLSALKSEDKNTMLVTLTEESKFSSGSQSSLLQHVDLRINGIPASEANGMTSKVEKLDVIRSAEKIEIRIPVLSGATGGDKLRASNSTISVYISSPGKGASSSHEGTGKVSKSGNSGAGLSRSGSWHSTASSVSNIRNLKKNNLSDDLAKVVPWWTTVESFRQSERIPVKSTLKVIPKNSAIKTVGVRKTGARVNQEVNSVESKKVTVSDAKMRFKTVVAIPSSSPRHRFNSKRKGTSAIPKIIENESRTKIEQQRGEQKMRHQNLLKKSESNAKPEAKHDTKVKSTASNEMKKEALSSMPGKSIQAETTTSDKILKKMSPSLGSTVATFKKISKDNVEPRKGEDPTTTNNLSSANDSKGKIHAKPISEIGKGNTNADIHGRTTSTRRLSNDVGSVNVGSKIGTKPTVEVSSKSVTNDASRLLRTCGKIKVLPCAQSLGSGVNRPKNDRSVSIKPKGNTASTGEKLSNVKNSTLKPIEKKKDGTLIDYGMTVTTGKKLERKLSGSRSTDGVQRKKIMKQEESAVTATIKEVISKRNKDVRSNAINRNIKKSSSKQNGLHKNEKRTNVVHDQCGALKKKLNKIPAKGTSNEPNESRTPKTSMNEEKRNSKPSNESLSVKVVNPDKKLLYSIWLGRLKDQTDQEPDPKKDPSCRDS